jgi:hypothetical protein
VTVRGGIRVAGGTCPGAAGDEKDQAQGQDVRTHGSALGNGATPKGIRKPAGSEPFRRLRRWFPEGGLV